MNSLMIMFYPHKFMELKVLRLKPKILEQETKVIRRVTRAHTESQVTRQREMRSIMG